ncbi:MAG: hypothetical protein ACYCVY_11245 [Acidiferrobacteraceae bacterium]
MDSIRNRDRVKIAHRRPRIWRLACGAVALLLACAPAFAAPTPKVPALTLVYDRTPAACHYLLHLYNRDLARKGYVDTRAHRVFRAIHWRPLPERRVVHGSMASQDRDLTVRVAFFDLTNSGHPVPVSRMLEYVGNDAMAVESLNIMDQTPKDFRQWVRWARVLHGHILTGFPPAGTVTNGSFYLLKHAPKSWVAPPEWPYRYPVIPVTGAAFRPLRYDGVFYVSISPYADYGRIIMGGPFRHWIVIGKFRPNDTFEDVCYFRDGALRPVKRR